MTALVGKYFIGVHDQAMRSGIVEACLSDIFYLVRFDKFIGFSDGSKWPEALAIVPIGVMISSDNGEEDEPPPWLFFDNPEQRAWYDAWLHEPSVADDRKPRVVPIRKDEPTPIS